MKRMKLGLVGAGAIAHAYVHALRDSEEARIHAIADVRSDAAGALAEDAGCAVFDSHKRLCAEGGCEAVVVCTPPATHPEICVELLRDGIPVLCEKPLAIDVASAEAMVDAASRSGAVFTMASKFRYVADVVRAKSILASGVLGEILLLENAFTSKVSMRGRWNADPVVSGGGVLMDNGTHSVDLVHYFLGPVGAVHAVEGPRVQGLAVEDTARLQVRSTAGVVASIDLSWSIAKEAPSFIDVYGTNGILRVGWRESRYRPASSPEWVVFGKGYDKHQAFRSKVENFCGAVRGDEALLIGPEDALASVEVIEAAYRSLAHDGWVDVEPRPAATRWQGPPGPHA